MIVDDRRNDNGIVSSGMYDVYNLGTGIERNNNLADIYNPAPGHSTRKAGKLLMFIRAN